VRTDEDGVPRLIASPDSFAFFVDRGFGRLRAYAAKDPIAALHWLRVVGEAAAACRTPEQIGVLRTESTRFLEAASAALDGPDHLAVEERGSALQALLARGVRGIDAAQMGWLGGKA
jgi:uncharacterized membrane protein